MAKNLIKSGYDLVVYNRSQPPVDELVRAGALAASSPAGVAKLCNTVILCMSSSKASNDVVLGEKGLMNNLAPRSIVIDTGTIDLAVAEKIATELKKKGHYFLDAPVSGGPEGASAATLSIMVGGDRTAYDRSEALLQKMGKNVFYLGESGSGLKIKLFNQALVGVYCVAVAEAYLWSSKMNIKLEDIEKVITKSWGDSPVLRHFLAVKNSGNLRGGAAIRNLEKDLSMIVESADRENMRMALVRLAERYLSRATKLGYSEFDVGSLYSILDKLEA